ncbi:MAG: hypothetical protein V1918_07255 [Planctomycetota bacterium]
MKKILAVIAVVLVAGGAYCLVRGKGRTEMPDAAPFSEAIGRYLKEKNMGMKVAGFDALEVQGDRATARCKMRIESDLYALSVRWTFVFQREEGGTWRVERHEQK